MSESAVATLSTSTAAPGATKEQEAAPAVQIIASPDYDYVFHPGVVTDGYNLSTHGVARDMTFKRLHCLRVVHRVYTFQGIPLGSTAVHQCEFDPTGMPVTRIEIDRKTPSHLD